MRFGKKRVWRQLVETQRWYDHMLLARNVWASWEEGVPKLNSFHIIIWEELKGWTSKMEKETTNKGIFSTKSIQT